MSNRKIWRFEIGITDEQHVRLPRLSRILKFAMNCTETAISMWVEADMPENDDWMEHEDQFETRTFRVIGTGHPIPDWDKIQHHDTLVANGGALIWHVYEVV